MTLTIDHVPIARSDLDDAISEFSRLGLEPDYGGPHGSGTTHMAVLGFDDGSYLELISGTDPGTEPDLWPEFIRGDAGPCAWCLAVDDVSETLKRAIDAGVRVRGPQNMARERPDGVRAEWDVGFLGGSGSEKFPFVIADRTPREYRVTPTESVAGGPLCGIEEVVVAVRDLDASIERFRRVFNLATPVRGAVSSLGATVASFPGEPLTLATPLDRGSEPKENRLAERLDAYGECPCACLLGVGDSEAHSASGRSSGGRRERSERERSSPREDIEIARKRYALGETTEWLDRRVAWFDSTRLDRTLGVVQRETSSPDR